MRPAPYNEAERGVDADCNPADAGSSPACLSRQCSRGGIGRRARLRPEFLTECRFDAYREHQFPCEGPARYRQPDIGYRYRVGVFLSVVSFAT